jgi:hypothetical protein
VSASTIFADVETDYVTDYRVTVQIRNLIVGGIPSDPSVIRGWLQARMDLGDVALAELLATTIAERDAPMSAVEKIDAIMASEHAPSVNGFKRNENGELCYEGRCFKAGLKEAANSAYPGVDYPGKPKAKAKDESGPGATVSARKGLMSTFVERVFVVESLIGLGVKEPTRVEERIKHVRTPTGPISCIGVVEVVDRPLLMCTIRVHDDFLPREAWSKIWQRLEDIGLGSDRARSDGQFDLLEFDKI